MKNLTHSFRRALYNRSNNYLAYGDITLSNNTLIQVTNSEIWTGGFSFEEGVSEDDTFTAIGSAVIGSAELIINNISEAYSQYDFTNAKVVLYLGMQLEESGTQRLEKFKIGTYTVDDTVYNGATIRLSLLDYMEQFDRPYTSSTLVYPATLDEIVRDACTKCGVMLNTYNFPHKDFIVDAVPDKDSVTYRDVISQCAAIAGCFAKMNPDGQLELKWFDTTLLDNAISDLDGGTFNPWSGGTQYNGGTFNPWTEGDEVDGGALNESRPVNYISALYSQNICVDDVIITGVSIVVENQDDLDADNTTIYSTGTSGYVVTIEDNSFITNSNAQTILAWLGTQLIGLRFRKLDVTCTSDPAIEAGDVGLVIDRKQNVYRILVTRIAFSLGGSETVVCGASTPSRNSATKFSSVSKTYADLRKQLKHEKSLREQMEEQLAEDIENSNGLYYTEEVDQQTQATKYYLHNRPLLSESLIQILVSDVGITVTNDGGQNWYGLTVNGNLIANILSATGVDADWINTGSLSATRIKGGTLTLGGENNINGSLRVLSSTGGQIALLDKDGLVLGNRITVIDTSGNIVTKSLYNDSYFYLSGGYNSYINMSYNRQYWSSGSHTYSTGHIRLKNNLGHVDHGFSYHIETYNDSAYYSGPSSLLDVTMDYENYTIECESNSTSSHSNTKYQFSSTLWTRSGSYESHLDAEGLTLKYGYSSREFYFEYGRGLYTYNITADGSATIAQSLTVSGTKNRLVNTKDYASRLLYCYETASPYFGDIGEGTISDDGLCYVQIDPIFSETITVDKYHVFLQKYGNGDCCVFERKPSYFVVSGTPGLKFSWELKAKQVDFDQLKLENYYSDTPNINDTADYSGMVAQHIKTIQREREVV